MRWKQVKAKLFLEKSDFSTIFSAQSLTKYGYEFSFTRFTSQRSTAVLVLKNGTPATINADGDINTTPDIQIR